MPNRFTRLALHVASPATRLRAPLPRDARERIEAQVEAGQRQHEALLRVAIENSLPTSLLRANVGPRERAVKLFSDLFVWDTEHNNGVLLYVLMADHAVEIVADRAAARAIEASQWQTLCDKLARRFAQREFLAGTLEAIEAINDLLARAFPAVVGEAPGTAPGGPLAQGGTMQAGEPGEGR